MSLRRERNVPLPPCTPEIANPSMVGAMPCARPRTLCSPSHRALPPCMHQLANPSMVGAMPCARPLTGPMLALSPGQCSPSHRANARPLTGPMLALSPGQCSPSHGADARPLTGPMRLALSLRTCPFLRIPLGIPLSSLFAAESLLLSQKTSWAGCVKQRPSDTLAHMPGRRILRTDRI
jgi:hypothetical protein